MFHRVSSVFLRFGPVPPAGVGEKATDLNCGVYVTFALHGLKGCTRDEPDRPSTELHATG